MNKISISTEAFKDGEEIPKKYTCWGSDTSPPLSWTGIPRETKSIVIVMEDPDAGKGTLVHWILFNVPPTMENLPEAIPKSENFPNGSRQGRTDFNEIGYGGPCPPPGKVHRYYFKIYALDKMLDLLPGSSIRQIYESIEGHIIAKGDIVGMFGR